MALVGACLRFFGLGDHSLWDDELYSVGMVTLTAPFTAGVDLTKTVHTLELSDSFWTWKLADPHPPLYELLLAAWVQVLGTSDAAVRALSALAGSATILVALALPRQVGPWVRVGFAVLLASGGMLIFYSQEARGYAIATLLASILFVGLLQALAQPLGQRDDGTPPWHMLAAALLLGLTHYYGVLFAGCIAVAWLWQVAAGRRGLLRSAAAWAGAIAPVAAYAFLARHGILEKMHAPRGDDRSWLDALRQTVYGLGDTLVLGAGGWAALVLAAATVVLLMMRPPTSRDLSDVRRMGAVTASVVLAFLLLVTALVGKTEFFHPRYLVFVMAPCLFLLVALAAWPGWRRHAVVASVGLTVPLGIVALQVTPLPQHGGEWRGAARHVAQAFGPGDVVVAPSRPSRIRYAHYLAPALGANPDAYLLGVNDANQLASALAGRPRPGHAILFAHIGVSPMTEALQAWLVGSYGCNSTDAQNFINLQVIVLDCSP